VRRTDFRYRPSLAVRTAEFREYVRLALPRAVAQPIEAITFLFFTSVASGMAAGSVSSVSFARNFQSVPVSLIGIAFSIAAFPVMSRVAASGDRDRFGRLVRGNVLTIAVLSTLAGVALALVAGLAIRVLLGGKAFDDEDVAITTTLLVVFAISVPLESLSHVLSRAIFATHETLLQVAASVAGLGTIVGTVLLLQPSQGLVALPLGFAAGMAVKVCLLAVVLRYRIGHLDTATSNAEVAETRDPPHA
jgi:putative peptidoglycan lipid II flippase